MRSQLVVFLFTALAAVSIGRGPQGSHHRPKAGFVPDEDTAVKIAEAVLLPIYGSQQVQAEKPFVARLKGETWVVTGHLPEGADGGVAEVKISKISGEILSVGHGK